MGGVFCISFWPLSPVLIVFSNFSWKSIFLHKAIYAVEKKQSVCRAVRLGGRRHRGGSFSKGKWEFSHGPEGQPQEDKRGKQVGAIWKEQGEDTTDLWAGGPFPEAWGASLAMQACCLRRWTNMLTVSVGGLNLPALWNECFLLSAGWPAFCSHWIMSNGRIAGNAGSNHIGPGCRKRDSQAYERTALRARRSLTSPCGVPHGSGKKRPAHLIYLQTCSDINAGMLKRQSALSATPLRSVSRACRLPCSQSACADLNAGILATARFAASDLHKTKGFRWALARIFHDQKNFTLSPRVTIR